MQHAVTRVLCLQKCSTQFQSRLNAAVRTLLFSAVNARRPCFVMVGLEVCWDVRTCLSEFNQNGNEQTCSRKVVQYHIFVNTRSAVIETHDTLDPTYRDHTYIDRSAREPMHSRSRPATANTCGGQTHTQQKPSCYRQYLWRPNTPHKRQMSLAELLWRKTLISSWDFSSGFWPEEMATLAKRHFS